METYVEQMAVAEQVLHLRDTATAPGIIIPTCNAAAHLPKLMKSLAMAGVRPAQVLVIDSSSSDATCEIARQGGYHVVCIPQKEFNHGGTRQLACGYLPDYDRLIFCTQDVILHDDSAIDRLSAALDDASVGAAYGRQVPRAEANAIEAHARLFNYPETSQLRSFEDRFKLGIRTPFMSNSFAIYRRSALDAIGGFPADALVSEETLVAAKMLLAGWNVAYKADAIVIHSHAVHIRSQFRRYFDIGVQHARSPWLMDAFGLANSEGTKFLQSEMRYLFTHAPFEIPLALLNTGNKLIAYRLGVIEQYLPISLKRKLSGHPNFWSQDAKRQSDTP